MTCDSCREVFVSFFQETLMEPLRFETSEHLSGCPDCRRFAEENGQWEAEFIRLNDVKLPEDWLRNWEKMKRYSERIQKQVSPKVQIQYPRGAWKFWIAGACLFLASTYIVFKYFPQKYKPVSAIGNIEPVSTLEPEALRELHEIARRFGVKIEADGKTMHVPGKVIAPGVQLKPFHAHLKFSSEEDMASFGKWIFSLKPDQTFTTPSLWVLSLNRVQLLTILEGIKRRKVTVEGDFPSASKVPIFEGLARISFYVEQKFQPGEGLLLYQHWHFFFHLTNRFDLSERLRSRGVKMLYETSDLWVFETPASNLKEVLEVVGQCSGLKTESIKPELLPDSGKVPIRISVYLAGR